MEKQTFSEDLKNLKTLVEDDDLDMYVSYGFVCRGSFKSFLRLRFLMEKAGINIIYHTASSQKLYISKIREVKDNGTSNQQKNKPRGP